MKKLEERLLYEGRWLTIQELHYENGHRGAVAWEMVRRRNPHPGVIILARLVPSGRLILNRQFRPAVNGYVLGLPAGLAYGDPAHALVELREETGYHGRVTAVSPPLKTGSSIIDDNGQIVQVEVDENAPENRHPRQQLEPGEEIEVLLVHPLEAKDFLRRQQEQGVHISSSLWYLLVLGPGLMSGHEFQGQKASDQKEDKDD